ncbi:MAG: histone-like nucleoid-structuring protein Lsr2 [Streptosporangiaceae bacterium]
MAQKVKVLLLCDLHQDETEGHETIQFSIDGTSYEVDLCSDHAQEMRDALTPFVDHARKAATRGAGTRGGGTRGRRTRGGSSRERSAEIRSWAKANGIDVNERGRIPGWIVEKYEAAH